MQNYNPEAVEAALVYAKHKELTVEHLAILDANAQTPWDSTLLTAARILAAEVERLREQNKRQGIDLCAYVAEVAELRAKEDAVCEWTLDATNEEYDTDCGRSFRCVVYGWDGVPGFCPGCGRKVKIQPQTNEQ